MSAEPYLSVVVTSRNDNHGGDLLRRFGYFQETLLEQAIEFDLPMELIVVDWNPPPDRPPLEQMLRVPHGRGDTWVRFIQVPAAVHAAFPNPARLPLYQFLGKNVGIRRARGRFVLATCHDLIFSDELIWFLARRELRDDLFYRIDRSDLTVDQFPDGLERTGLLAYCADHLGAINGRACRGNPSLAPFPGTPGQFRALDAAGRRRFLALGEGLEPHINACGDFTLMTREAWMAMGGYPELTFGEFYVDGLAVHQALGMGLTQAVLAPPLVAYHIFHKLVGVGGELRPRLKLRPCMDWLEDYLPWCLAAQDEGISVNPNGPMWGLADLDLPEQVRG
jgi:hypothetical protein